MKEKIIKNIEDVLKEFGIENPNVILEYSSNNNFGDYTSNVAMSYAKQLGKKPLDLAEEIKSKLNIENIKIEVASPGFINFFFDREYFGDVISKIIEDKNLGKNNIFAGQKFFIEHTQPNPFKIFHIGHLMNNTIGESVFRIVQAGGAEVQTATYHGDVGLHVAKAVWALKKGIDFNLAYAEGHKSYEDDEKAKQEIIEINKKIYDQDGEQSDPEIIKIYEDGRQKSLESFEDLYERLDSHFDFHFYESEAGEIGGELVRENIGTVFEKGDPVRNSDSSEESVSNGTGNNAPIVFHAEKFDKSLHTRVFLNSEGLPTYEAKELGLAQIKKDWFPYDKSITVTANEQDSFFKVVEVAIGEVFPELKGKLKHLSHGMLKLPTGKMSSRTGTIISAEDLIEQVKQKVLEKMKDGEVSENEKPDIAEMIAISAIKYSILRQAIGGDIIFDFDKSISFEGDSGPYLQYSTVRARSLMKKADGVIKSSSELLLNWSTTNLERLLERFPNVVEKAGREYAPHHIATYLVELSSEFNSFYAGHKIIDEGDGTSSYRIAITTAFYFVMMKGLDLLAIRVPEKM